MSQVESISLENNIQRDKILWSERWESTLLHYISLHNFCKSVRFKEEKFSYLIGKKHNIEICSYLYSFYKTQLFNLAIKSYQEYCSAKIYEMEGIGVKLTAKDFNGVFKNNFLKDYLIGGCDGIYSKMSEQKRQANKENSSLNGLMVINDKEIEKYVEEIIGATKKGRKIKVKDNDPYDKGFKDGKNINEHKGVKTETKDLKLI